MTIDAFSGKHAFLSNFYSSTILIDGLAYPTVEHAYQAQKSNDKETRRLISILMTPGQAKAAGRRIIPMRQDWESIKLGVMRRCLEQKFAQDSPLAEKLLQTGDEELIEGNYWRDTFYGVYKGEGLNWLGRLLMERRTILRTEWRSYSLDEQLPSVASSTNSGNARSD